MIKFYQESPDDVDGLFRKAYIAVAVSFGARSSEPCNVHFAFPGCKASKKLSYILRRESGDYEISYNRNKLRGKKVRSTDTFTLITGDLRHEA